MRNHFNKPQTTTAAAFLLVISTSFITGCGGIAQNENTENDTGTADITSPDNKIASSIANAADGTAATQVIIDPHKCVGCGKCVRVAPNNFQMNNEDKAVVTSQQNAEGSEVLEAQQICPGDAITIVKA